MVEVQRWSASLSRRSNWVRSPAKSCKVKYWSSYLLAHLPGAHVSDPCNASLLGTSIRDNAPLSASVLEKVAYWRPWVRGWHISSLMMLLSKHSFAIHKLLHLLHNVTMFSIFWSSPAAWWTVEENFEQHYCECSLYNQSWIQASQPVHFLGMCIWTATHMCSVVHWDDALSEWSQGCNYPSLIADLATIFLGSG